MCEPTTWIAVIGLVIGAASAAYQIDATNKAADAQEEQAVENAKGADAQARSVELAGQVQEDQQRARVRAMLSSQRTAFAANNVDMSTGTPLELLGDTAALGEQDALTIRAQAAQRAWGIRSGGVEGLNQAAVGTASARNNATGTWLTYAGNTANKAGSMYGNRSGGGNLTTG